ncbi:MAG: FG-GAP-like repeat-containing protein, partial [Bacteroidota bacterium]
AAPRPWRLVHQPRFPRSAARCRAAPAKFYFGDNVVQQELIPSRGFQSSIAHSMTIGLGAHEKLDSLRIVWPNDKTTFLTDIPANQSLEVLWSDATDNYNPPLDKTEKTILQEISNSPWLAHDEDNYNDFDYEGLLFRKLSQEGPAMAVGDINGDGHEDVFVGGAQGKAAMLYVHEGNGRFVPEQSVVFETDQNYEDTAACFLDADTDGDLDLMVAGGGNEVGQERSYRTRLYLNNGKGNFEAAAQQIPSTFKNSSVIAPHDYDGDGDVDVFIGSRNVVGIYGVSPDHLLLENREGQFVDATERRGYDLKKEGMVTDALWADMDGDGKKDLVTVSEWDVPKIHQNTGRRVQRIPTSLDSLHGWWNTVEAADLDNDGDLDLILGNQGENLHYRPEEGQPMKLWINDFDGNGSIEQIVTINEDGQDFPIHQKKEVTGQLVSLKKENLKASEYAKRTIQQLFPKEIVERAIVKKCSGSASVIAINNGKGNFKIKKLPPRTQFSCICGISCQDINNDGHLDLVMAGNDFEYKPQFSRLDASYGNVLLGDGKLNFSWKNYAESGFFIRDEVKHLKTIKDKAGNRYLIAAINDRKPKIFALP